MFAPFFWILEGQAVGGLGERRGGWKQGRMKQRSAARWRVLGGLFRRGLVRDTSLATRQDPSLSATREASGVEAEPFCLMGARVGCVRPTLFLALRCWKRTIFY